MEKIPQIYNVAADLYGKFLKFVKEMCNDLNNKYHFNIDEASILKEFDNYIQCILFKVAISDKKLIDVELSFISNIVKNDNYFKNIDLDNIMKYPLDEIRKIDNNCSKILSQVPAFVALAVMLDKKADEELRTVSPTHSEIVYDWLKRICNYLKFVDGSVAVEEEKTGKMVLANAANYFRSQKVSFSPRRKIED